VNVLSNLASFNPWGLATKITDIYLKDREVAEAPRPAVIKADTGTVMADPALLASYCGKYEIQPGVVATISMEGNTLYAEAHELARTPMKQLSSSEFEVNAAQAKVTFQKDENGKISKMLVNMQGQEITAIRLPDFDPLSVNINELTGDFYSAELNTTYTLSVDSGKLIARHFRTGDVKLTPLREDVFSGDRWYFGYVEFIRDGSNTITGCKVGNGRVSNLKFDKVIP
jgi:hypothetical protein